MKELLYIKRVLYTRRAKLKNQYSAYGLATRGGKSVATQNKSLKKLALIDEIHLVNDCLEYIGRC